MAGSFSLSIVQSFSITSSYSSWLTRVSQTSSPSCFQPERVRVSLFGSLVLGGINSGEWRQGLQWEKLGSAERSLRLNRGAYGVFLEVSGLNIGDTKTKGLGELCKKALKRTCLWAMRCISTVQNRLKSRRSLWWAEKWLSKRHPG